MRIQIISQYYHPDNFRINDIAAELVRQGHSVEVLTGLPDYATSKVPPKYQWFRCRREVRDGVAIRRVPIIARHNGILFRVLNYMSFATAASLYALFHKTEADVLFVSQTSPVFQAMAALVWKWKHHKPVVLYCYDLWPESLKAWNVSEQSLVYQMTRRASSFIYKACDIVAITSTPFRDYLTNTCEVDSDKIVYLPQHAEDLYASLVESYEENSICDFVFAGNIGSVQNVDCILRAASCIGSEHTFRVHIVGDGSELEACKQLALELKLGDRVVFHGRHPLEAMLGFYQLADCFLLTLRGGDLIGMTLPGKAQGYLSAGRPIVAAIDGAGAEMIQLADCGGAVPAGDSPGLARLMEAVITHSDLYREKGRNGRNFYEQNYTKEIFMEALSAILEGKH